MVCIGPESILCGGAEVEYDEPFLTMIAVLLLVVVVVAEWRLLASLNHITVIPCGIDTSAGSKFEMPVELNGIVIA